MAKKHTITSDIVETAIEMPASTPSTAAKSKKARLISMLSQKGGSTIAAISAALGWQAHTTRAAITGLRKAGHTVETARPAEGGTGLIYRIAPKSDEQVDGVTDTEAAE